MLLWNGASWSEAVEHVAFGIVLFLKALLQCYSQFHVFFDDALEMYTTSSLGFDVVQKARGIASPFDRVSCVSVLQVCEDPWN